MAGIDDRVIAVDIDGTVATVNADYARCEVMPGARESLLELRERGFLIYLHTGRHINNHDVTVKWLADNAIPYDLIVFGKPPARYYIDDRAIAFVDWESAMSRIEVAP
jgi:uncharacterized HAD superfamily protein